MAADSRNTPEYRAQVAAQIVAETYPHLDFSLRIEAAEYADRSRRVQAALTAQGFTLGYTCGSELDRSDIAWLAAADNPIVERYGMLLGPSGPPVLLAGPEGFFVMAEAVEESGARLALITEFAGEPEDYRMVPSTPLDQVLRDMDLPEGPQRVAILATPEVLPLAHYRLLCDKFGDQNVVFAPEILQKIKYNKSPQELHLCQQANLVADAAMRGMLAAAVPGARESAVAGVGELIMKELGAARLGFPTIVDSGDRNYTLIAPCTDKVMEEGELISAGVSPTWHGYHGAIRRSFRLGVPPTPEQQRVFDVTAELWTVLVKAIARAATEKLPLKSIDRAGKEYLSTVRLTTLQGQELEPFELYPFIHNSGCSECLEGYGAANARAEYTFDEGAAEMIDVGLGGFLKRRQSLLPVLYVVLEDSFWVYRGDCGIYNQLPLDVQGLVGDPGAQASPTPFHRPFV